MYFVGVSNKRDSFDICSKGDTVCFSNSFDLPCLSTFYCTTHISPICSAFVLKPQAIKVTIYNSRTIIIAFSPFMSSQRGGIKRDCKGALYRGYGIARVLTRLSSVLITDTLNEGK